MFFFPALAALAVAAVNLWREQAPGAGKGVIIWCATWPGIRAALAAGLTAPLAAAAILMPLRASWPNVALLLVVVVMAVAAIGKRAVAAIGAVGAAAPIASAG